MGKLNMNNEYRNKWLNETIRWATNKGYVINPEENERFTCPRCGRTRTLNKYDIHRSQFGYRVCPNCYKDEMKREELGEEQVDTRYWYVFSNTNLGK